VGEWDVGMMNLQTARNTALPSENFGVYRLRRQVFNANSYAGGMLTTRLGENGEYNVAYGLDGIIRVGLREYLEVKWAQTFDDARTNTPGASGYGRLRLERRGQRGFGYTAAITWEGRDFDPGIGFVSRNDFTEPFLSFSYGWYPNEESSIRVIAPRLSTGLYFSNQDGAVESVFSWQTTDIQMKSGDVYTVTLQGNYEDLPDSLSFPEDTSVPPGQYSYYSVGGAYRMGGGNLFRTDGKFAIGTLFDGWNVEVGVEPTWNLSRRIELGAEYQYNRVRFSDRNLAFDVHLARIRAQLGMNTKASVNAFVQYNTADDALSANIRFRYNFSEGNDIWLVYNEGMNIDRYRVTPTLPRVDSRTILLKYTYTLIR
jgi:hypothetical protein